MKYTLLLPLPMLMVFVLVLVLVVLLLLLVVVLVVVLVAAASGGCGAAANDSVCFKKLNGFLQVKYARIFWIYLTINDDSMYFKYC
jgi:hypothetical protein